LLGALGPPDFGERRNSPELGAEQGGLGLSVDVEVGVRRAVQGAEPLGGVGLGLGQLGEGRRERGNTSNVVGVKATRFEIRLNI
jgi:hypothetical protein